MIKLQTTCIIYNKQGLQYHIYKLIIIFVYKVNNSYAYYTIILDQTIF